MYWEVLSEGFLFTAVHAVDGGEDKKKERGGGLVIWKHIRMIVC